ncbi:MAG: carbon-nitrogen hydrolase family protein [Verrucomicrobiota bacterium]|jgi:predicted amidohydrolase
MIRQKTILKSIACFLFLFFSGVVFSGGQSLPATGHTIHILSLCFKQGSQPVEAICQIIDREAAKGLDLVCLPEEWPGSRPESIDGPTMDSITKLAKKHHMYIVCPMFVKRGEFNYNTSFLIDRDGKIAGFYDKAFPYWSELNGAYPTRPSQNDASVFDTDFGKVGLAICFDAKFPEVFQRLQDNGAELVVWSSAYSGFTELQAYATLHHYYIVTSTWTGDCLAYDITGHNILDQNDHKDITVAHIDLDMDRQIFHYNFNQDRQKKLLKEHGDDVFVDCDMPREEWFVLKAKRPGVSVHKLGKQYDLEPLLDYFHRSRQHLNELRGFDFAQKYVGYPK